MPNQRINVFMVGFLPVVTAIIQMVLSSCAMIRGTQGSVAHRWGELESAEATALSCFVASRMEECSDRSLLTGRVSVIPWNMQQQFGSDLECVVDLP